VEKSHEKEISEVADTKPPRVFIAFGGFFALTSEKGTSTV